MAHLPSLDAETHAYLRRVAGRLHARGGRQVSLQPTALLHEAWLKVASSSKTYESKGHFLAVAAQAMRHILVDRSRARLSQKRGGDWVRVTLSGVADHSERATDVLDLDRALGKLEAIDPEAAQVAMLLTFGGMTGAEVADVLGFSVATMHRHWRFARVYLARQLGDGRE